MKEFGRFEDGYEEGYGQGYIKGYIAGIEYTEDELLRPDDYCPKTTPISEILEIPCMNCPIEDRCDFNGSANIYLGKDYFGENDFDFSDFDDFDDDEYEMQLSYNTEPIERFQAIIEEVANISGHIGHIRCKCFQDKDMIDRLDDVRESIHNIVERLRELQEESAIDEMYEFICKNY